MRAIAIAVAVAACGGPELPIDGRGTIDEPRVHVVAVAHVEAPPAPPYARTELGGGGRVVHAVTTGTGHAIALTQAGDAAVTVDLAGAVRLWPALDGTREPVVVPARRAAGVALGRDSDGFVIGALDSLGQLEVLHLAGDGLEDGRAAIDAPRPFLAIRVLGARVLALRDDQVIAVFDGRGALVGELAAPPGERIAQLAVRGERALAIVERDDEVRGRWLEVAHDVAWGRRTAPLAIDATSDVALSPSGKRVAAVALSEVPVENGHGLPPIVMRSVVIVELATGKLVATPVEPAEDATVAPLGFVGDDRTVAVHANFALQLWSDGVVSTVGDRFEPAAAAGGHAVSTFGQGLVLMTAQTKRYLGYRQAGVTDIVPRAHDLLGTDGRHVFAVDPSLHALRAIELALEARGVNRNAQVTLLDDHHALVAYADDKRVIDLDHPDGTPVKVAVPGSVMSYTRSSHVLVTYRPSSYAFAAFDSATGRFGEPVFVTYAANEVSNVFALDPAATNGRVAAVSSSDADSGKIVEIVDVRRTATGLAVDDKRLVALPRTLFEDFAQLQRAARADLRGPDRAPGGGLATETMNGRLSLRDAAGQARWTRVAVPVTWTADGRLLAFDGGLAFLDLATGEATDRQCGWEFGLYDEPLATFGNANLCEAP